MPGKSGPGTSGSGPSGGSLPPAPAHGLGETVAPVDRRLQRIARGIAIGSVVLAIIASLFVWRELTLRPRTTDAFVRANVVGIAAHVGGNIVELNVVDNQRVEAGDLLFVVDPRPFEAALAQALASLDLVDLEVEAYGRDAVAKQAELDEAIAANAYAQDYLARIEPLLAERFVTPDEVKKAKSVAESTAAAVRGAQAQLASAERRIGDDGGTNVRRAKAEAVLVDAQLNLSYCTVRAPVGGYVTNLNTARGEYANVGEQVFALVDDSQWYVLANYRETLLGRIEPGMVAEVWVLACPGQVLRGVVQGVGKAIFPPAGSSVDALPDVAPALDWVRLAQRFPVRIVLDHPPNCTLHSGSTATVRIMTRERADEPVVDGVLTGRGLAETVR